FAIIVVGVGWRGVVVVWPKTVIPRRLIPPHGRYPFRCRPSSFPARPCLGRDDRHFGSVLGKGFRPVIPPLLNLWAAVGRHPSSVRHAASMSLVAVRQPTSYNAAMVKITSQPVLWGD
ncbi:MAG: hypothetical protein GY796_34375, partial [Chloroflexi bacterium]|nr:hypothetical protein [Chloroflexota bacterium]